MLSREEMESLFFPNPEEYTCLFFSVPDNGEGLLRWFRSRSSCTLEEMGVDIKKEPRTWGAGLFPIMVTVWKIEIPRDFSPREFRAFLGTLPSCLIVENEYVLYFADDDTRKEMFTNLDQNFFDDRQCMIQRSAGRLMTMAGKRGENFVTMKMGDRPLPGERKKG